MNESTSTSPVSDRPTVLKQPLWAIITENVVSAEEVRKHRDAHLEHQVKLERAGIMFGVGPLAEPDGTRVGRGLIIIRADSEAEAREIADTDPMHSSGVRQYTLYQWQLAEGHIQITLNFSDRDYRLE